MKKNGVSVSAIGRFLDCREQFRLRYPGGWRSRVDWSAAIDYGELWHYMFAKYYATAKAKRPPILKSLKTYQSNWRSDNAPIDDKRWTEFQVSLSKFMGLWERYWEHHKKDDAGIKWLASEREFRVSIKFPGIPYPVDIHGILDGVFEEDGLLWLMEHKTKGRIDEWGIEDGLHLNIQVMAYLRVIQVLYPGKKLGGVCYNVIRNPQEKPKRDQPFNKFSQQLVKKAEKNGDHYFKRWRMKIKSEEVDRWWETQLNQIILDMYLWTKGGPHYINPNALDSKYGRSPFFGLITSGSTFGLYKKPLERKERER